MSRVGKLPVQIPSSIKLSIVNDVLTFESGKEKKSYKLSYGISAELNGSSLKLNSNGLNQDSSMFIGMDRSNIKNIVLGLSEGFKTVLEINGVGYKASVDKSVLVLTLGYSHEIFYSLPEGISAAFEKPNLIVLSGNDKILVGQVAAEIISFRKPEPYKGKGVKVFGKKILRKEGKKK